LLGTQVLSIEEAVVVVVGIAGVPGEVEVQIGLIGVRDRRG
jgi:hypothetical protein